MVTKMKSIANKQFLLAALVFFAVSVGFVCYFHRSVSSNIDGQKRFVGLLNDWGLDLPADYTITQYELENIHSEWGTKKEYYRLELEKTKAESLLNNPRLAQQLSWSKRSQLIGPNIDWWKAETNSACYFGFLVTPDTHQYIYFNVVLETGRALLFVESLSKEGGKKL